MSEDEALDEISNAITGSASLECWFEGKTLTVMVPSDDGETKLVKLRLVKMADRPSPADLRGEPE